jgi:type IV pilus assembly protein PilE
MSATSKGFSLIELMVTVVIVAVLAGIAYPSYTNHLRKGQRAEAKVRLTQVAQLQERYFTEKNTYTTDIAVLLGFTTGTVIWSSPNNTAGSGYQITAAAGDGSTIDKSFKLEAAPQGSQTADTCGTLRLLHTGKKEISGSGTGCW